MSAGGGGSGAAGGGAAGGGDALAALLAANEEFYRAFEAYDLPRMERIWVQSERCTCVHPGWQLLRGWADVRESWLAIFSGMEVLRFTLSHVQPELRGDLGWVTLHENIANGAAGAQLGSTVLATNILERGADGEWRLLHHHASHVLRRVTARRGAGGPRD
jgi:ketosteroid isomerase-like protein